MRAPGNSKPSPPLAKAGGFSRGKQLVLTITVVELTRGSGVTQGAISQHLKSLKQAGLVTERPEGRHVYYRAEPEGLAPLVDWMSHYGVFWRERFANLRNLLKEIDP